MGMPCLVVKVTGDFQLQVNESALQRVQNVRQPLDPAKKPFEFVIGCLV
jgi:hypothetical protein